MPVLLDDSALLRRFRDGDRGALEVVYRHFVRDIWRLLRLGFVSSESGARVPGISDRALLADAVQEVFVRAFGDPIDTPHPGLDTLFPRPAAIAALDVDAIAKHGVIAARARAIIALAQALDSGKLRLDPSADVDATLATLIELPGVGPWTAQYIAMRALAWPDAFPHPDVATLKAMGAASPRRGLAEAEAWRPWRAYAVMHLWKSLEE